MVGKQTGWDDTIVALATPPGVSAIGVVRITGSAAIDIAGRLLPSKDLAVPAAPSLHVGFLEQGGAVLDEVVVSVYRQPRSYTGENLVEISAHGSPFILRKIIDACVEQGARLAKPGEFTLRAFLNGKLDLAQAEAVADLIASNTLLSQHAALNKMRGGFSQQLKDLREKLIRFSALIELELDFSQEDVEFADRKQLNELIQEAIAVTASLARSFRLGNAIRNGISVAIIGRPNAGKSTLLNLLLNEDRAIVSEIPGTTRDTIEEVVDIGGILFRLIDTAGIRQHSEDVIESMGISKSLEKMKQADLVLYVFDVANTDGRELMEMERELSVLQVHYLFIGNKIDVADEDMTRRKFDELLPVLFVSAATGQNIEQLKTRMAALVLEGNVQTESTIITSARHFHVLQQLQSSLAEIQKGLAAQLPGDLLSPDIRRSLQYLGEITGEITNEEQLDYIFSKFCIGK